jgi:hypothetical protein
MNPNVTEKVFLINLKGEIIGAFNCSQIQGDQSATGIEVLIKCAA